MIRAKEVGKTKEKEYIDIDRFLNKLYNQGYEVLSGYEYREICKIADKGTVYYTINPFDSEINQNKSIIFGNDEDELDDRSDLLSEEI
jgi:hypothetical protein